MLQVGRRRREADRRPAQYRHRVEDAPLQGQQTYSGDWIIPTDFVRTRKAWRTVQTPRSSRSLTGVEGQDAGASGLIRKLLYVQRLRLQSLIQAWWSLGRGLVRGAAGRHRATSESHPPRAAPTPPMVHHTWMISRRRHERRPRTERAETRPRGDFERPHAGCGSLCSLGARGRGGRTAHAPPLRGWSVDHFS